MSAISRSVRFRARRAVDDVWRFAFELRLRLNRRRAQTVPVRAGLVTVIVVTWNTRPYLENLLRFVDQFPSDDALELLVIDNASSDGTSRMLRTRRDVRVVKLLRNVGHGLALDRAVHICNTEYFVTLDVDAFPIAADWIETVVGALRRGARLAGGWYEGYVHPSFLAMRREDFLSAGTTFDASYTRRFRLPRPTGSLTKWDAGQLVTYQTPQPHHHVPISSVVGPGALGTVFGEVVYHHFYSTRLSTSHEDVTRSGVTQETGEAVWRASVDRYLPLDCR